MGDISTWNPVDNSNTTAPPDGWPEGMAPSAVNNSARAMMGAVRRWYDTVTAQLASFLPLSGGTLSGGLMVTGTITTHGPSAGLFFGDRNQVSADWDWAAQSDVAYLQHNSVTMATVDAGSNLTITGGLDAGGVTGGYIHSTGDMHADNAVTAPTVTAGFIDSTGDMHADNAVTARAMTATETIQAAQLTSTGNINAAGTVTGTSFIGNVSVPAGGPITTGGTVTGGQVTSTGNANVAGSMTAGSLHATGNLQVDGSSTVSGSLFVSGPATLNAGLTVTSGTCGNVDGTWQIISDVRVKTGVADYKRGLDAILALQPRAYHYRAELFGAAEAEKVRYGLVADEVAPVVPEMVGEAAVGGRNLSTLNTGPLNFILINACRELAAQNAALAARITALEGNHV